MISRRAWQAALHAADTLALAVCFLAASESRSALRPLLQAL
jgi:hypothetical protein